MASKTFDGETEVNLETKMPSGKGGDSGLKYDGGKLRMDLLPPKALEELAKVLSYGADKYADNSWQGVESKRYTAALLRHLVKWMGGEARDPESGLHHLSHVLCNAAFLAHKEAE